MGGGVRLAKGGAAAQYLLVAALAVAASAFVLYPAEVYAQSPVAANASAMCLASFDELDGAQDVDTFSMGNGTYAIVASYDDHGVQLMRIGDGGTLSAVSSATNGFDNFTKLYHARAVDAFNMSDKTYAIVASWGETRGGMDSVGGGVQLIRVHENGTMTPEDASDDGRYLYNFDLISEASDVDVFTMGNATYAMASTHASNRVDLIRVHENGTLSGVNSAEYEYSYSWDEGRWKYNFSGLYHRPYALDVFDINDNVYAAVVGSRGNHTHYTGAIQIIRIYENGTMTDSFWASDGWASDRWGDFVGLGGARDINVFTMGNTTYALVASHYDDAVQLIHVHENGSMSAVSSVTDDVVSASSPFNRLEGAEGIDTFAIGGDTYAIVSASVESGIQLIRVHDDGNLTSEGSLGGRSLDSDIRDARAVDAFVLDGMPYGIVASYLADAVQVVGIGGDGGLRFVSSALDGDGGGDMCPVEVRTEDAVPTMSPAGWVADGGPAGFDELEGAWDVDTFAMDNDTYAVVASDDDDGVQLIRIGAGGSLTAAGTAADDIGGFDELGGARAVDAFSMGDDKYAIVASFDDSGVQLIRVHENGTMAAADSATDDAGGFWTLAQASDVDTFAMGGATYALASSYSDSAVQLIRVHENGTLSAAGSATNNVDGFDALWGPRALDAFDMGGDAYAVVASERSDGVQLIRVHENGTMSAAGSVFDDPQSPGDRLDGPRGIGAFAVGDITYAIVASYGDKGVQLIRIHENGTLSKAGSAVDTDAGDGPFDTLEGASGVDTLVLGNRTYAIVASSYDNDATLIRVHENGTLASAGSVTGGGGTDIWDFDGARAVDAFVLGNRTYAIVASYDDDAVQLVSIGGDGRLSAGASVSDHTGFVALGDAEDVDSFAMGGSTYIIAASREDGVQLIRVHENGTMSPAGSASRGDDGFDALRDSNSVDAFAVGNRTYAMVTLFGTGVQLIRVHENGTMSAAYTAIDSGHADGTPGFDGLANAHSVDAISMGNRTYAIVSTLGDDSVHLIRVHWNGTLAPADSADAGDRFFGALGGARHVDAFAIGNDTFAIVSSHHKDGAHDGAVQLIRVGDGTLAPARSAIDGSGGFGALGGAYASDAFDVGNRTFSIVAAYEDGAVQVIRVHGNGTMMAAGSARTALDDDSDSGFDNLLAASDVDAFALANHTYAAVVSPHALAVQLIRVHENGALSPAGAAADDESIPGTAFGALGTPSAVVTFDTGGHTYAAVSSGRDSGVQLVRMAPSLHSIDSTSRDGTHGIGAIVDIRLQFYGNVYVAGHLELRLNSGGVAEYHKGSGTSTLTFRYKVAEGDRAADLDHAGADALSGSGSIADALGIAAYSALPEVGSKDSLGGMKNIAIETDRPSVESVSSPNATGAYGTGDRIAIHVEFTEPVYVTGMPLLELDTGGGSGGNAQAAYSSGSGTGTLVFVYSVRGGDASADLEYAGTGALDLAGGVIADRIGNNATLALPDPDSADSLGGSASIEIDTIRPSVESVSSPNATGAYGTGDRIAIHVEFTEPVYVTGMPLLELDTGGGSGENAQAPYSSGSGTGTLVFVYSVRGGDASADLEYAGTGALDLAGGTIRDIARNNATLALPDLDSADSLSGSASIEVDGTSPSILSVSSPNATGSYGTGDRIAIHVEFTEPVYVTGMPLLELEAGGSENAQAEYASGNGTTTLVFVYSVRGGDASAGLEYAGTGALELAGGTIRGGAGNDAVPALPDPGSRGSLGGSGIAVDGTSPSILSVSSPNATGSYGTGDRIAIHVEFTEPVYVAGMPLLELDTGSGSGENAQAEYASGNGTTTLVFVYSVRGGDASADLEYAGTGALELAGGTIRGGAGNDAVPALPDPGSRGSLGGSGIAVDGTSPSILSVSSPNATGSYGTGDRIAIHVEFTEPVYVAGMPLLELDTGGGTENAHAMYASGSGNATLVFVYSVRGGDASADLGYAGTGSLELAGGAIADRAGNNATLALPDPGSENSLSGSAGIEVDTTGMPPPVSTDAPEPASASVLRRAGGDPLQAPATYSAGDTIVVGVRFTAPVAVDASGGVPYLGLRTGSAGARAPYAAGSGTDVLEFAYVVRGGDMVDRLSYAGAGALALNGGAIAAAGSPGTAASVALPEPGAQGSLSHTDSPAARIIPEPGRPVLDVGIIDDEAGGASVARAAMSAAERFNEQQGRIGEALLVRVSAHDAGATAESAAEALRAAHSSGAGPSVYVGPSTDRGLHAAMPYAAANGIVLVSAGSTAPSLAAGGDTVFRLLPSDRLEADALARHAGSSARAELMYAVLENATYGPPAASGSLEDDNLPPPQGAFSHGFDEALSYSAVPTLSGTIPMGGAAGSYDAAAAAEALDAAVRSAGGAQAAVVYLGSPGGLAALAESSAGYVALASAPWFASGLSAGSVLLEGGGAAAGFAAQAGLSAARWSVAPSDLTREIDSLLPAGSDAGARHRAYAAYDAVTIIGTAAAAGASGGDPPGAVAIADSLPGTAAEYSGALGDIALDYAGDLWVPARYDLWTVAQPGGAGSAAEWSQRQDALDGERACSITLTRAKIDYGPIDSGQTSRPHLQTIVNTGQLPFARVDLTATPWHVDSPGACQPGDSPSLPVGLSEIRTELGGQFSDLAGSGTVLAQGLGAGGQAPLWYRLSLAGYADLPQAQITQCATYVVRCS